MAVQSWVQIEETNTLRGGVKKLTLSSYCKLRLEMNRIGPQEGWEEVFLTPTIFAKIAKISDSVDFEKRTRFFPFSVSAPRNNVGDRRSDNFEGSGRAQWHCP